MSGKKKAPKPICETILKSCPILDMILETRDDVARLKGDVRWMKWLLLAILATLLGTAALA